MDAIRGLLIFMFILILGCLLTSVQGNEMQNSMQVLSEVKAQESFVRLKHLVPVLNDQKSGDILICRRPVLGKPVVLTRDYIEKLLVVKGAESILSIIDLPSTITVRYGVTDVMNTVSNNDTEKKAAPKKTEIDFSEVLILVTSEVEKILANQNAEVSVYARNKMPAWYVDVPADYELKLLPGLIIKSNMVSVKIGVYNKDELVERKSFNLDADVFVQGLACSHDIDAGYLVKEGDFVFQKTLYSTAIYNSIKDEKEIIGKVLKRSIKIGSLVEEKDLELPTLVTRNDLVSVTVKSDHFEIKTSGISQDDGKAGDFITVVLKGSKKKVTCIVRDQNSVEVFN